MFKQFTNMSEISDKTSLINNDNIFNTFKPKKKNTEILSKNDEALETNTIKKKKNKVKKSKDIELENKWHLNENSIITPKKDEKHKKSFSTVKSITKGTVINIPEKFETKCKTFKTINYCGSIKSSTKKEKHTTNKFLDDTIPGSKRHLNESIETIIPKKKKKYNKMLSLLDLTINNDAENNNYVHNKTKQNIENIIDIDSSNKSLIKDELLVKDHQRIKCFKKVPNLQEHRNSSMERNTPEKSKKNTENTNSYNELNNSVTKKRHTSNITDYAVNHQCVVNKNNELVDVLLENNYHLNESLKTISPKKKKKHGKNSDEFLTNIDTDENVFEKNAGSIGNLTDGYCENIVNINLQDKKKKNKEKSVKLVTKTVANKNSFKNTKRSIENINSYDDSNEFVVEKKRNKNYISKKVSLENNGYLNESHRSMSPRIQKKHKNSSVELVTNGITENHFLEQTVKSIRNINDNRSYESVIKKKNYKSNESLENNDRLNEEHGTVSHRKKKKQKSGLLELKNKSTENNLFSETAGCIGNCNDSANVLMENSDHLNENHGNISHRRKKKHKNCFLELKNNTDTEENLFENTEIRINSVNNIDSSKECVIKKKNLKSYEPRNVSLEDKDPMNENHQTISPKKKKKHDKSLVELMFNVSNEKAMEMIGNGNESANVLLENNDHLNENHGTISHRRKKKRKNCSFELKNNSGTEENLFENTEIRINSVNNIDSSKECVVKKKNHKSCESTNVSLEDKDHMNENHQTISPKKEKKHDQSSVELMVNSSNEKTMESIGNGNDSANLLLENNDHLNENHGTISHRKKKKHKNCSFESVNSICTEENLFDNTEIRINHVNNIGNSNESVIIKKNHKSYESHNVSLKNNDHINESHQTLLPKKKKKHEINSVELMTDSSTKQNLFEKTVRSIGNIIDDDMSHESVIKKKKHEINKSANVLLERNDQLNTNISDGKKKKHESSSLELKNNIGMEENFFENTERRINIVNNIDSSNESVVKKNNHKSYEPTNVWLQNKDHLNENSGTVSPRENKKHEKSSVELMINSSNEIKKEHENNIEKGVVEFTTKNCTEVGNCDKTKKKRIASFTPSRSNKFNKGVVIYEDSLPTDVLKIVQNIKLLQNNFNDNDNNTNIEKNKCNTFEDLSTIENSTELEFDNMLNKNVKTESLRGIISLVNAHETSNSITSKNEELNSFDLFDYLVNANPSMRDDCNFKPVLKDLSRQISKTINSKCKKSDIDLLKYIGEKILKKVVEKHKSSKAIEHLHIELPNECKKNKMHFVETMISRGPSIDVRNNLKKLNPSLKSGTFSKEESDSIKQRCHKFQQEYNLPDVQPFLSNSIKLAIPSTEERLSFFRYISADLPNRLLSSVYVRFNKMFSNCSDKVSFNKEEDEIIMKVDSCEAIINKHEVLNLLLNRSRDQLYKRLKSLKLRPYRGIRVVWDLELRQKLFDYILLETKTKNWRDLKNKTIKLKTWIDISKHFSTPIHYEQARSQWNYLSTMLFCEKRIDQFTFKLIILEYLLKTNPIDWKDVNWVKITNLFYPGANAKLIVSMFHWWVDTYIPPEIKPNIRDSLQYLSKHPTDHLLKQICDGKLKLFPRLIVKNNALYEI